MLATESLDRSQRLTPPARGSFDSCRVTDRTWSSFLQNQGLGPLTLSPTQNWGNAVCIQYRSSGPGLVELPLLLRDQRMGPKDLEPLFTPSPISKRSKLEGRSVPPAVIAAGTEVFILGQGVCREHFSSPSSLRPSVTGPWF